MLIWRPPVHQARADMALAFTFGAGLGVALFTVCISVVNAVRRDEGAACGLVAVYLVACGHFGEFTVVIKGRRPGEVGFGGV